MYSNNVILVNVLEVLQVIHLCLVSLSQLLLNHWRRFLLTGGGTGVWGQSFWSGGRSPPEAEKKLHFDNTKPLYFFT